MCRENQGELAVSGRRGWKLVGRCDRCGAEFALYPLPDDLAEDEYVLSELPCQAVYAHIGNADERVYPLVPPPDIGMIMTRAGISPMRLCMGRLQVVAKRNPPFAATTLPVHDLAA